MQLKQKLFAYPKNERRMKEIRFLPPSPPPQPLVL